MRSKLPPRLEEIRLQIAGTHNTVVMLAGLALMIGFFGYLFLTGRTIFGHENDVWIVLRWIAPDAVFVAVGFGMLIWLLVWNDNRLCRQTGFICQHCGKPLYQSDSGRLLDGLCPHCARKVTDEPLMLSA